MVGPGPTAGALAVESLVEVDQCDFAYGAVQVLFNVSFTVAKGERLALLGTNGAGKSTALRLVSGLSAPARGRVRLRGDDVSRQGPEARALAGVCLISGGRAVFPALTVEENLEMFAFSLRRESALVRDRTERALATFPKLAQRLRQPAGALSGGEQQQLALTKALLLQPDLLCVDELSLGLAPIVVESLMNLILELSAEGMTILLVEQSLNVAAELCARALFMEKGEVRFEGPTKELLEGDHIARAVFFGRGDGPQGGVA